MRDRCHELAHHIAGTKSVPVLGLLKLTKLCDVTTEQNQ